MRNEKEHLKAENALLRRRLEAVIEEVIELRQQMEREAKALQSLTSDLARAVGDG